MATTLAWARTWMSGTARERVRVRTASAGTARGVSPVTGADAAAVAAGALGTPGVAGRVAGGLPWAKLARTSSRASSLTCACKVLTCCWSKLSCWRTSTSSGCGLDATLPCSLVATQAGLATAWATAEGRGRPWSAATCCSWGRVRHFLRASAGCRHQESWAAWSQRRRVLGSTPSARQHAVKGTSVMIDAPFRKHSQRQDTRGVPGTAGSLPAVPGISLGSLPGTAGSPLAGLEALAGMADARLLLMLAPPARPGQDQGRTAGRREQQACQQAARFGHRERTQLGSDPRF